MLYSTEKINMSYNQLWYVNTAAFAGLTFLRILILSSNSIIIIQANTFFHLKSLTSLHLDNISLKDIMEFAFVGPMYVTNLDL